MWRLAVKDRKALVVRLRELKQTGLFKLAAYQLRLPARRHEDALGKLPTLQLAGLRNGEHVTPVWRRSSEPDQFGAHIQGCERRPAAGVPYLDRAVARCGEDHALVVHERHREHIAR